MIRNDEILKLSGQADGNGGFSSQNVASDEKEEKTRVAACVAQVDALMMFLLLILISK